LNQKGYRNKQNSNQTNQSDQRPQKSNKSITDMMRHGFKINVKIKPNITLQNQCYQRGTFQNKNNQFWENQSKSNFLTTDVDCNQYPLLRVLSLSP